MSTQSWLDQAQGGFKHHCGVCNVPLTNPKAQFTCIGVHMVPCAKYHTLFYRGHAHDCRACIKSREEHFERVKRIVELLDKIIVAIEDNIHGDGTAKREKLAVEGVTMRVERMSDKVCAEKPDGYPTENDIKWMCTVQYGQRIGNKSDLKRANEIKTAASIDYSEQANLIVSRLLQDISDIEAAPKKTVKRQSRRLTKAVADHLRVVHQEQVETTKQLVLYENWATSKAKKGIEALQKVRAPYRVCTFPLIALYSIAISKPANCKSSWSMKVTSRQLHVLSTPQAISTEWLKIPLNVMRVASLEKTTGIIGNLLVGFGGRDLAAPL
jgi:hypothetical protein